MKKELKTEQKEYSLRGSCLWGLLLFGVLLLVDMLTKIFADAYFSQPALCSWQSVGIISKRTNVVRGYALHSF